MLQRIEIILGLLPLGVTSLGWLLHPIGYLSLGLAGAIFLHLVYDSGRRRTNTTLQAPTAIPVRPTERERELTEQEKDWIAIVDGQVLAFHGHNDWVALAEDCQRGRELSRGLCGTCGYPRNRTVTGTSTGRRDDGESRQRKTFISEHQWHVPFL